MTNDEMPSEVSPEVGVFDRFAERVAILSGRPLYFMFCLAVVLIWLPSFSVFPDLEQWQLPINTFTTVITFLTVAVIQNTQNRSDKALQKKLNAIADGLSELMKYEGMTDAQVHELCAAVGLERRESS